MSIKESSLLKEVLVSQTRFHGIVTDFDQYKLWITKKKKKKKNSTSQNKFTMQLI